MGQGGTDEILGAISGRSVFHGARRRAGGPSRGLSVANFGSVFLNMQIYDDNLGSGNIFLDVVIELLINSSAGISNQDQP